MQLQLILKKPGVRFSLVLTGFIVFLLMAQFGYATAAAGGDSGTTGTGLAKVAGNVIAVLDTVANAIAAAAYIAGIGFGIGAIMKFKQHKDNPTQIPVGTPIALLFIAVALVFLPTIIKVTGETLFAGAGHVGGPAGKGIKELEKP